VRTHAILQQTGVLQLGGITYLSEHQAELLARDAQDKRVPRAVGQHRLRCIRKRPVLYELDSVLKVPVDEDSFAAEADYEQLKRGRG
jgi:hypothetical protein